MKIKTIIVGNLLTNTYIIENDNACLVIDPGADYAKIVQNITCPVVAILLTHRHFDHIGALEAMVAIYHVPVLDASNLSPGTQNIGGFSFEVIKTPGHTADSLTFLFPELKAIMVGDFIFASAIGRMDLGGNAHDMKKSLELILNFADDLTVYPGHGPKTTLGLEKNHLRDFMNTI